MPLVDTRNVEALAAAVQSLLPEEKAAFNTALGSFGVTLKAIDDLTVEAKADIATLAALAPRISAVLDAAESFFGRAGKVTGAKVDLIFSDDVPGAAPQ